MVHDSPTNAMKDYIHHNIDTPSIKDCENCKHFAPILNIIKTKNSNKTQKHFPARRCEMIVTQVSGHVDCQCFVSAESRATQHTHVSCLFRELYSCCIISLKLKGEFWFYNSRGTADDIF